MQNVAAKNQKRLTQPLSAALLLSFAAAPVFAQQSRRISGPFFNQDEASSYTDPYRGIHRIGSDLESLILSEIESATKTLDIAVQELRLPNVARALARKQGEGVAIRMVVENEYNYSIAELDLGRSRALSDHGAQRVQEYIRFVDMNGDGVLSDYEVSQRDAISIVRTAKIPLIDDTHDGSKGSPLMHHKFLIVDGKRLLVTSANFTMSDVHGDYTSLTSRGNANALLVFQDAVLVREFQREFDILWGSDRATSFAPLEASKSRFGVKKPYRSAVRSELPGDATVTVQFAPTPGGLGFESSTSGLIDRTLSRAQKSVRMALFVFSEQRFANTLQDLRDRFPIDIKVLVEPNFAYSWFSEVLDLLGLRLLSPTCKEDLSNNPWKKPIASVGIPVLDKGDFLHHKFAVIDDKTTIFGSQNWSGSANDANDENLLVIEDTGVAAKFSQEFQRLYAKARLGAPSYLLKSIKERETLCR
jgi:phosphatidylserine/phosphatidylglycerophosphate/cardiolipin synthase-like enzyme